MEPEPTAQELVNATYWRILRDAYLQPLARSIGKRTTDLTPQEANALLDPFMPQMLAHQAQLEEVGRQHALAAMLKVEADASVEDLVTIQEETYTNDPDFAKRIGEK